MNAPHHSSLNNSNIVDPEDASETQPEKLAALLEQEKRQREMLETSKESLDKLQQETGESKHESNEAKIAEIKQALMSNRALL